MKSPKLSLLAVSVAIALTAGSASAELARVGPNNPSHGYPDWYQDKNGLALSLCLPSDQTDLNNGNCLILPADVPSGTAPETFPSNFSEEHFWYAVDAGMPVPGSAGLASAGLVLAVEAAFGTGPVVPGDQVAFGRIRVKYTDLPQAGDYRITHPYGTLIFTGLNAGDKIFFTDDVGITCAKGDFTCALQTGVGPFLRPSAAAGGDALPFVTINGKTMLADPALPTAVTGSPFGNNVFRIEVGDAATDTWSLLGETEQFTVMGRVYDQPIPQPMAIERATYTRKAAGTTWLNVFANAAVAPINVPQSSPVLSIASSYPNPDPLAPAGSVLSTGYQAHQMSGVNGKYFGQTIPVEAGTAPSQIAVVNTADAPPSYAISKVTDEVTISAATYDPVALTLSVTAKSSDEALALTTLQLEGYGALDASGSAVVANVQFPPEEVVVLSPAGGKAHMEVAVLQQAQPAGAALDDSASTNQDTPVAIDILGNDSSVNPTTVQIVSQPLHGLVAISATTGAATYTPAPYFFGPDSFSYVVQGLDGRNTNVATVNVAVANVNDLPVATNDTRATVVNIATQIDVLFNDTDADGKADLNPASVTITTPPASGTISVNPDNGFVTFTPAATGTFSFAYQVADQAGALSNPATVTVNVAASETIAADKSMYRTKAGRWIVVGTSSVIAGQEVTLTLVKTNGTTVPLGTAVVDALGDWVYDVVGNGVVPASGDQVRIVSPLGGTRTVQVSIRD